jgi:restriction system protein
VRAGKHGEREQFAVENNCAVVGWQTLGDLSAVGSRDEMANVLHAAFPSGSDKKRLNHAAQLWAFIGKIETDDLVALPMKASPAVAIGRVTGPYRFQPDFPPDAQHTRPVEWLSTDVPRASIGQDLLFSLGAFMTVCEVKRNGAAARLAALATTGKDPGAISAIPATALSTATDSLELDSDNAPVDIEQLATDRMRAFIGERFTGHDLARLVEAVLQAQGFSTFRSPAGTDGGIDVLAGAGPLGTESPKICVQVKSGDSPVDVKVVRELQGVLSTVHADQGLLVAWAGLTKPADAEARAQFFRLRVWTADDVINAVTRVYDQLSADIQAELPLKRVWTVVPESEGD